MSDPKEILERRLDKVAETQDTYGLHFFCQIGSNIDPRGLTTLQVAGSGGTLLSWRRDDENQLFSVELAKEDHLRLFRLLRTYPFWDASPSRRGPEEDDTNIHLRFADQAAGTYGALQFWDSDMDEFPVLVRLMRPVVKFMRMIGQDEFPHLSMKSLAR